MPILRSVVMELLVRETAQAQPMALEEEVEVGLTVLILTTLALVLEMDWQGLSTLVPRYCGQL